MNDTSLTLIGNAHIDPVWLWRWQEGFSEIKATFLSALDRMDEDPDFYFVSACASYYRFVEENAPAMFERIRARVREGRWVLAGGMWVQPDCNAPSGESFARHLLYSQRYFLEKFGVCAQVGYNVDSFGHSGGLPQLLRQGGLRGYVFMRPGSHENAAVPGSLFVWKGLDGTRLPTYRIPFSYTSGGVQDAGNPLPPVVQKLQAVRALALAENTPQMCFFGVGNHGGGPTREELAHLHRAMARADYPVRIGTPDAFFAGVEPHEGELPLYEGDLQFHAKGCYSTNAPVKKLNRMAEHRLGAAERLGALAAAVAGHPYRSDELARAWQRVLFQQFHDVMGGCSVESALEDAGRALGEAVNIAEEQLNLAVQRIAFAVDTSGRAPIVRSKATTFSSWEFEDRGAPVVVFNPTAHEVTGVVTVNYPASRVTDEADAETPCQMIRAPYLLRSTGSFQTAFRATVPPLGYRTYWTYRDGAAAHVQGAVAATINTLENACLRLEIDPRAGGIRKLIDKGIGRAVVEGGYAVAVDIGMEDTWAHRATAFRADVARFGDAELRLIDQGPLRGIVRAVSYGDGATLQQDFTLDAGAPYVDVRVHLSMTKPRRMVKLAFPTPLEDTMAVYETAYAAIGRACDGDEQHGQRFADLSGKLRGEAYGLALINDGRYSYDALKGELRLTAVNTSYYADHVGRGVDMSAASRAMDLGETSFCYRLYPHAGSYGQGGVPQLAEAFLMPPIAVQETYHEGLLPQAMQGIQLNAPSVALGALKRAEDGGGYVLRLHETAGEPVQASVSLPFLHRALAVSLHPYQVATFYLPDGAGPARPCDLLER